ncbi:hypothetical protein V5O48_017907 [Marasmius crinis-equi]|uniref:GST N-terminal domain-containing protein n=1 Tax=Marasmius crinis-equi TaxID=585013 RepID=A0ABR3EMN4_9AGAR
MITLYDLGPHKFEESMGMSPFVRGVRFALHFKKIPYKAVQLSMHEIESTAKSLGVPPTTSYLDGTPRYTVPFIQDSTTGKIVSDSFNVAEYLDEAYPDTPRIIPPGTRMLQATFCTSVFTNFEPLLPVIRPVTVTKFLPAEVAEALKKTFGEAAVKSTLTPEEEAEVWKKVVLGYKLIAQGYGNRSAADSAFVMGGTNPTFADMALTGFLWWIHAALGDTQGWKDIAALGGGKFGKLVEDTLTACKKQV